MRRLLVMLCVCLLAGPATAQKFYTSDGGIRATGTMTAGDCAVVDTGGKSASFTTCPGGGGGSGDITDVWTTATGNVNALTAAAGDTFDAGAADSSKPCKRGTTLPGTCAEGDCFQDSDSGGLEVYFCTAAPSTWTKGMTATDIDTSAELLALVTDEVGTGALVFNNTPSLLTPFISDYTNAGHTHASASTGGTIVITTATTGTLPLSRGGTNATAWTASRCVQVNAGGTALESASAACGSGGSGIATLVSDSGSATGSSVTITGGVGMSTSASGATLVANFTPSKMTNFTWSDETWASAGQMFAVIGSNPIVTYSDNLMATSSRIKALSGNATFTADPGTVYGLADTYTMNYTGGQFLAFRPSATIVFNDDPLGSAPVMAFVNEMTVKNETGDPMHLGLPWGFKDGQRVLADAAAVQSFGTESFTSGVIFDTTGGGTLDVTSQLGFSCVGQVKTGATLHTRLCYRVGDLQVNTGTVEDAIGINIESLSATLMSIGLRNYDTTVFIPKAAAGNNPVTAGTAITLDGTVVQLTASGHTTMTATPTIADPSLSTIGGAGMDGQWVTLVNADTADSITLQDESALTGSNLELRAKRVTLRPGESIMLTYNATVGAWVDGHSAGQNLYNTATSGIIPSVDIEATDAHASGSPSTYGLQSSAQTTTTAAGGGTVVGTDFFASCFTTNGCTNVVGLQGFANKSTTGTVTNAYGGYFGTTSFGASGAITNAMGVYIEAPAVGASSSITNAYGLYLNSSGGVYDSQIYGTETSTNTSGATGISMAMTANHASATPTFRGGVLSASTDPTAAAGATMMGVDTFANCANSAGCTKLMGISAIANKQGTGTVTTAYGGNFGFTNIAANDITVAAGVHIQSPFLVTGSIGTAYGLLIEDNAGVNDHGIYVSSAPGDSANGITVALTANSTGGTPTVRGIYSAVTSSSGAVSGSLLTGVDGFATCATTSTTCGRVTGVSATASQTAAGVATSVIGLSAQVTNTGSTNATQGVGVYIAPAFYTPGGFSTLYALWADGPETSRFDGPIVANDTMTQAFTTTSTSAVTGLQQSIVVNPASGTAIYTGHISAVTTGLSTAALTTIKGIGASASCDMDNGNGCTNVFGLTATALKTANTAGTVTNAYGVYGSVQNLGTTTSTITNAYVIYSNGITNLGTITNKWQFYANGTDPNRFGGPVVLANPATQSLTADASTISCANGSFKLISATATRDITNDPQIADGISGQICMLEVTGANTIKLDDGFGLQLTAASITLTTDDIIQFVFNGTDWMQMAPVSVL